MKSKQWVVSFVIAGNALLVGCASTPTLYQWEGYQSQVYVYLKGQDTGVEAQILELEMNLQKIHAKGNIPPPGFHAHLGLLYSHLGQDDKMIQEFLAEKTLFPESTAYINFLLKKTKNE